MTLVNLLRALELISVGPAFLKGLFGKYHYLNTASRYSSQDAYEALENGFFHATNSIVDGTKLSPAGYYTGIWCRDASYILNEILETENNNMVAARWLRWIWDHRLTASGSKKNVTFVRGRGSPGTGFRLKVADEEFLDKFAGALPSSIQYRYSEFYGRSPDIDSTALMISVTSKFCLLNPESDLTHQLVLCIKEAISYLESRDTDGDMLLEQGPNEDWMDSMLRSGKIVYSQAAYVHCLLQWSKFLHKIGKSEEGEKVNQNAKLIIRQVQAKLWRNDLLCYADMHFFDHDEESPKKLNTSLTQDISLFLMLEGEQDRTKANTALDTIRKVLWTNLGPSCVQPPFSKTGPFVLKPFRYQNGGFWPWITSLEIIARLKYGRLEECRALLEKTLPYSALEWINPHNTMSTGSYPFRTGIAAVRTALRNYQDVVKLDKT